MKLTYCKKCVMPSTKPDLFFDADGICDACRSSERKLVIDWGKRKKEFERLTLTYRSKDKQNYDCIIPVSGGKDSTYQTYLIKKVYGLNPLCVCFEPTYQTELGRHNLQNLNNLGVDLIYFKKNPQVYKKMVIEGFRRVGDNEWPNHVGIFTVPVRVAVNYQVPLIIWGENSQMEYGGPRTAADREILDRRWLEEFGGLLGNRVEDMLTIEGISKEDLLAYTYPRDEELKRVGVRGIFLGYYFQWDARKQVRIILQHGFNVKTDGPVEGTYTNYENLDEATVSVHDYLKFLKYGFGRATDHACLDIRNGRISRDKGLTLVRKYDGKYPHYGVQKFIEYSGLRKDEVDAVFDRFTNTLIFQRDSSGNFIRDDAGNLIKVQYDNE